MISVLATALLLSGSAPVEKTDVVTMLNGDQLTVEIRELTGGRLRVKTIGLGTITIDWEKIAWIETVQVYRVEDREGAVHIGALRQSPVLRQVIVLTDAGGATLNMEDVVYIDPLRKRFLDRVDGYVSAGINYAQAGDILTFSFSGKASYLAEAYNASLRANSIVTSRDSSGNSLRQDVTLGGKYYLPKRWFGLGSTKVEQNDELGIDLRAGLTLAAGNNLIQTPHHLFWTALGLSTNREFTLTGEQSNLEGVGMVAYEVHRYSPDLSLTTYLEAYPNLENDRYRLEFDSRWRWEMFRDFYWEFRYYHSYDSQPPSGALERSDYGLVSSIVFEF